MSKVKKPSTSAYEHLSIDQNENGEGNYEQNSEASNTSTASGLDDGSGSHAATAGLPDQFADEHMNLQQNHLLLQQEQETRNDALNDPTNTDRNTISISSAIERLGMGRFQLQILVASGLCFASDAMQVILLSFLSIVLASEWSLTSQEAATVTSVLFAGAMFGTLVLGPAADSIGRRPVFLLAAAIISSAGMASALAPNYSVVRLTVFITGFGVGGLTVPFDILAEFLPSSHRGTNLLLIEYFWTAGCLFVVLAAYLTLSGEKDHWRIFVAICSLPCVASFIFGFLYVPESPRWLCTKGKTCRAMEILRTACLVNGHDPDFVFPPHVALMEEPDEAHASVSDLFQPKWRLTTLRLLGTWVGFAFGYYGTVMAVTRVFASYKHNNITQDDEHLYSGDSRFLLSTARITNIGDGDNGFDFDYRAIFFTSVAEFLGTTAVILKVESWGRIPLQVSNVLPD